MAICAKFNYYQGILTIEYEYFSFCVCTIYECQHHVLAFGLKEGKYTRVKYMCMCLYLQPPRVRCETRIWHPNINEDGEVCLSLLRQNSLDSLGWAPTRKMKDVIWGLHSLFGVSIFLQESRVAPG